MALKPNDPFELRRGIWTEADYDQMGWHDVVIHGVAFDTDAFELLLDIDYMFAWVDPEPPAKHFTFWLSPATLVFRDVWGLKIDYDASLGLQLQDLSRSEPRIRPHPVPEAQQNEFRWVLSANEGELSFWASGFTQYIRREPIRVGKQSFSLVERGGHSFDRKGIRK